MVTALDFNRWMLDVLQWGKYTQYFPTESFINTGQECIVVVYGQKTLGLSPFSLWKPYFDEGKSPEEAIEIRIANGN